MRYGDSLKDQQHTGQGNEGFEQKDGGYTADFGGTFQNLPAVARVGQTDPDHKSGYWYQKKYVAGQIYPPLLVGCETTVNDVNAHMRVFTDAKGDGQHKKHAVQVHDTFLQQNATGV